MKKEFKNIKTPGFKTPDNYFETLEQTMLDKIKLEETISKQKPFQIPDGYFETFEKSFLDKIDSQKASIKVIPLYKKKVIQYAAAVAAIFIVALSIFKFNDNHLTTATDHYFTYSTLIESDYIDLSSIDFEYLLTDEMLNDESFLSYLSNDELEDYLLYELDDTYLLYE